MNNKMYEHKVIASMIIAGIINLFFFSPYYLASITEIIQEGGYYPSAEKASWMDSVFLFLSFMFFCLVFVISLTIIHFNSKKLLKSSDNK